MKLETLETLTLLKTNRRVFEENEIDSAELDISTVESDGEEESEASEEEMEGLEDGSEEDYMDMSVDIESE